MRSNKSFANAHLQTQVNQPRIEPQRIESPTQYTLRPHLAPYGMRFGEENEVKQKERVQYKEDLDYLCNLRKQYGEMSPQEWEEYNRKLNYMNDVCILLF